MDFFFPYESLTALLNENRPSSASTAASIVSKAVGSIYNSEVMSSAFLQEIWSF